MPKTEYAFGRSKVFIRNPKSLFELEEFRQSRNIELLTKIQAVYRGFKLRRKYKKMKKAQLVISSYLRSSKLRRKYLKMRNAAIVIQSYVRMWKHRKAFLAHRNKGAKSQSGKGAGVFGTQNGRNHGNEDYDQIYENSNFADEQRRRDEEARRLEEEKRRKEEEERRRREEAEAAERRRILEMRNRAATRLAAAVKGWLVRKRTRALFRFAVLIDDSHPNF